MTDTRPFYPHSLDEAKRNNDVDSYNQSAQANIDCKNAIETVIKNNYNGQRLGKDLAKQVIAEFGIDRTAYVLANTVKRKDQDGRMSTANKEWAKEIFVPPDKSDGMDRNSYFVVDSHTGLTDLFINQFKREVAKLNLWDKSQVNPPTNLDFEGKIMVLKSTSLDEKHKNRDEQLFVPFGGFGCSPTARGRTVMGTFLLDGERANLQRSDFLGEAKKEFLPAWATEKLALLEQREKRPSVLAKLHDKKAEVTTKDKPPTKDKEAR